MKLKTAAWVIVADGQKHLIFENRGDPDLIDLRVRDVDSIELDSNTATGTDRPGRFNIVGNRHIAVEQANRKDLDKARFSTHLANEINAAAEAGDLKHFVLMADPKTISTVRSHLSHKASERMVREIVGDFTNHSIGQIEKAIGSA